MWITFYSRLSAFNFKTNWETKRMYQNQVTVETSDIQLMKIIQQDSLSKTEK